jgi:DNA-binding LytR/AlgR family response regulator
MNYHCLIVDDEPIAHRILEGYLKQIKNIGSFHHAFNAPEARQYLTKNTVDILLLDIEMPEETGIDFLKSLEQRPITIFTTAFLNYTLEGYELGVMDYLVKPIRFERFQKAIERAVEFLDLQHFKSAIQKSEVEKPEIITIQSGQKQIEIKRSEITHVQGLKDYAIIHTAAKRFVVRETMSHLATLLAPSGFVRVHKSFIVSEEKLVYLHRQKIEFDGFQVPVGRSYREQIKNSDRRHIEIPKTTNA